jgi:hypothetical protein
MGDLPDTTIRFTVHGTKLAEMVEKAQVTVAELSSDLNVTADMVLTVKPSEVVGDLHGQDVQIVRWQADVEVRIRQSVPF